MSVESALQAPTITTAKTQPQRPPQFFQKPFLSITTVSPRPNWTATTEALAIYLATAVTTTITTSPIIDVATTITTCVASCDHFISVNLCYWKTVHYWMFEGSPLVYIPEPISKLVFVCEIPEANKSHDTVLKKICFILIYYKTSSFSYHAKHFHSYAFFSFSSSAALFRSFYWLIRNCDQPIRRQCAADRSDCWRWTLSPSHWVRIRARLITK